MGRTLAAMVALPLAAAGTIGDAAAQQPPTTTPLPSVTVDPPSAPSARPARPAGQPAIAAQARPRRARVAQTPRRATQPAPAPASGPAPVVLPAETATGPVQGYKANLTATGTKTSTPIRDIPQAIVVVPRQVIDDQGAVDVKDVLRNVSGVQYNGDTGGRGQTFTLRGFETSQTATDGLLNNRLFGTVGQRDLVNIERVEVLKGPASVLFGQNPPGGLINFVTKRPTATPFATTELWGGSFGFFRSTLDTSAPLWQGSDLSYRLNLAYDRSDTFRGYFIPSERFTIAPILQWQPSADTTVTAELLHSDQKRQFDRGFSAFGERVVRVPLSRYFGERFNTTSSTSTEGRLRVDQAINEDWSVRFALRGAVASANSIGINAEIQPDGRTAERTAFTSPDRFADVTGQGEITGRFATGILNHTLLLGTEYTQSYRNQAGALYDLTPIDIYSPVNSGLLLNRVANPPFCSRVSDLAGYAQDQIDLPFGFKLIGGVRVDADYQSNRTTDAPLLQQAVAASPRGGLVWQPSEFLAFYGSYSTSFVPQSGQDRLGNGLAPETGQQYEAGIKLDLLDKKLSATLAFFDITKQNVATTDPLDPDFSILTGEQRSRGVELDVAGQLTEEWRIISAFAYTDAFVSKDNVLQVGNRLYNVPRFSGSVWSVYEFKDGWLKGLGIGAGVFAVGRRYGDLENDFTVPGYARVDASAWYMINPTTRLQVNVKNLFDKRYIDAAVNRVNIFPGDPLTVTASLRVTF